MRRVAKYMVIVSCVLVFSALAFSQDGNFKPTLSAAEAAWNVNDFETAFRHYNGLLLLYSRDPSYRYYTGACLVMLKRDMQRAVTLLGSAINSSVNVKTVPDDVWFYYGRSLQMNGDFTHAVEAYNKFVKTAGRKTAQEYEVQKYIDECSNRRGALSEGQQDTSSAVVAPLRSEPEKPDKKKDTDVPKDYDNKLAEALELQYVADSLTRLSQRLRREMEAAPPETKDLIANRATELERQAAGYQVQADSILITLEPAAEPAKPDTNKVEVKAEAEIEAKVEVEADVAVKAEAKAEIREVVMVPVYSVFETGKTASYNAANPIPIGKGAPAGLVYRIQLAAFKNPVSPSYFKGLYPLYGKKKPESGVTFYYAGIFRTQEAARQALPKVKAAGFSDAFVVAMMNDIQISPERAEQLEKEWAAKPLLHIESNVHAGGNVSVSDTIPMGTLTFRAEVLRSSKPVKPDVTEKIEFLAGSRGLDIVKNKKGETVFLVGNFITFESADEYVSLLIRNGYPAARVTAYVGVHEIPVEAARELLKNLEND